MKVEGTKRVTRSAVRQRQNSRSEETGSAQREDTLSQGEQVEANKNDQPHAGSSNGGSNGDGDDSTSTLSVSAGSSRSASSVFETAERKARGRARPARKVKTPASRRKASNLSRSVSKTRAKSKKRKRDDAREEESNQDNGQEEWEVESILDKRVEVIGGTVEYKVQWKNFSRNEATWEPLENVEGCVLVERFENRLQEMAMPAMPPVQVLLEGAIDDQPDYNNVAVELGLNDEQVERVLIPLDANVEEDDDVQVMLVMPPPARPQIINLVPEENAGEENLPPVPLPPEAPNNHADIVTLNEQNHEEEINIANVLEEFQIADDRVNGNLEINEVDDTLDVSDAELELSFEEVEKREKGVFYESLSDFVCSVGCFALCLVGMLTTLAILYPMFESDF